MVADSVLYLRFQAVQLYCVDCVAFCRLPPTTEVVGFRLVPL
ncbi:hypothetical protein BN903_171 [Halorubrum sp. AJ67]|nr:hypothetical protein BN903_171 [Halorubrum sp. AJ67]